MAVAKISPHVSGVTCPAEIKDIPCWLMWRFEHHDGETKPRKVPLYVSGQRRHGQQGSPEDRRQLTTFDAARAAAARKGMDGVGLALLPEWGLCALDFDNCITAGELNPEVAEIAAQSYAEYSPSGTGVRVLFKGNLLNRKSFDGEFGFETFSTRGFVTVTGNALEVTELLGNENTIAEVTPEASALFRKRFGQREDRGNTVGSVEPLGLTEAQVVACLAAIPNANLPYEAYNGTPSYLEVGMAVHTETRGEGFDLWDEWAATSDKYTGRQYGLERWQSFGKQANGPQITGRTLVRWANGAVNLSGPASPDEFEALVDQAQAPTTDKARFVFEPVHSFASATALEWWVKQVMPKAGLVVLYGASGSGKSFVMLDMGMAIARGVMWRGKRVRQGRVAYIAAEGSGGFRKRITAYAQANAIDLTQVPMTVLNAAPNLMDAKESAAVAAAIQASGGADIVVVDTFAQAMAGGNENAGEDVGKALGHCKRIHEATGALVVLVHHSGKDAAKGARGWSGLKAAADAELEVVKTETGARYMRLSKSKDDVDGLEFGFELQQVRVGVDDDLDPITSCVVIDAEVNKAKAISRKLGPREQAVVDAFQVIAASQVEGIEVDGVLEEALARVDLEGKKASQVKSNLRSTLRRLLENAEFGIGQAEDGTLFVR
jgi:hypothetical protein